MSGGSGGATPWPDWNMAATGSVPAHTHTHTHTQAFERKGRRMDCCPRTAPWWVPSEHLDQGAADGPYIALAADELPLVDALGGKIIRRALDGIAARQGQNQFKAAAGAKVSQDNRTMVVDENVGTLNVAMNNGRLERVQVIESH